MHSFYGKSQSTHKVADVELFVVDFKNFNCRLKNLSSFFVLKASEH